MSARGLTRVAALTGGKNVPSARFRVRQLIPTLRKYDVEMREFVSPLSRYPPHRKSLRPLWAIAVLASRLPDIIATHRYDIVLLQRELLSTLVTLEPLIASPCVLDVDDAIFLYANGKLGKKLAQLADLVICGNNFLAENFARWNKNITVIPTGVDTCRYTPARQIDRESKSLIVGWIGTSGNLRYLYQIESALGEVLRLRPNVVLRVVADKEPVFQAIPKERLDFVEWSPEVEVKSIQSMHVGIMPLVDDDWERGKCSYKMLQYMACGIPVAVSPVGMNAEVLSLGQVGVAAKTEDNWVDALLMLLSDHKQREEMGINGRYIVEEHFSVDGIARHVARELKHMT